jgi:hypothetical protein
MNQATSLFLDGISKKKGISFPNHDHTLPAGDCLSKPPISDNSAPAGSSLPPGGLIKVKKTITIQEWFVYPNGAMYPGKTKVKVFEEGYKQNSNKGKKSDQVKKAEEEIAETF